MIRRNVSQLEEKKNKIDFKKELETASKGMIMIHDPNLLIKMIIRMIVRKVKIRHAGMILFDPDAGSYVLSISRGETGLKIPSGFTRFTDESPIIKIFNQKEYRSITADGNAVLLEDINKLIWREGVIEGKSNNEFKALLHLVEDQMNMLNAVACVPAQYHGKLMAILLLGAKCNGTKYKKDELEFFAALASDAAMAIENAQLFEHLKKEAEQNRRQFIQTIIVLSSTIEAKDAYTHGHTERVTNYSLAIARQMVANGSIELPENYFENLHIGALLHDIGKIGVPEAILHKHSGLTDEEYSKVKLHTTSGAEIIRPLSLPQVSVDGIKYHHERYDGGGYPHGLRGDAIPLAASIIAVADAYDAMITDRPYRKSLEKSAAINEIIRNSGVQFDPRPVKAMIELYRIGVV
ncbi:MAG: HD-GYP domain-containing protein [Candidatus Omnitrophica bacterium]|nr:HD-GYP domain-containing protein [Candidatus Omnitrophota bacterium]MBU1995838.1 HD-GYP domain-containing protein [Candidatus Omnitrophota bacterium]MBU4334635.1 HD-GYP domain-containing protein [Candidatus Omnitrophota bacterium]